MQIPIEVISLRRSAERRERFVRDNGHLQYEFVDARDGAALMPADLVHPQYFIHPLPFAGRGAYGCALSHLGLWEKVIAKDRPLTIAEDDAVFRHDFAEASQAVIARLPADWDLLMWGWNFDSVLSVMSLAGVSPAIMLFDQGLLRENIAAFQASATPSYPLALDRCFGTIAYTISPAGARKFRQACFPMKNFEVYFPGLDRSIPTTGIDIAMCRVYSATNSFAAFPPLVATRNETHLSTVQPRQPRPVTA